MAGTLELITAIYPREAWAAHAAGRPIMLYFFTPDCGACKSFHGRMVAVTSNLVINGELTVLEMNYEAELPAILADQLKIEGFPAMAFVVDGEVRDIQTGASSKRDFQEWIQSMMENVAKESA